MSVLWEGADREEDGEAPPPVLQGVRSGGGGGRPRSAVSGQRRRRRRVLREAGIDWTEVERLTSDRKGWKAKVAERMEHLDR